MNASAVRMGLLLAFASAVCFSIKPILVKWLYTYGITAVPLLFLRMLFSMPIYVLVGCLVWRRTKQKPSLKFILLACCLGVLGYYVASLLDLLGLEYVSAQLERLMLYAYPSIVLLLSVLFMGHRLNKQTLFALFLTYCGLLMVYGYDMQIADNSGDVVIGTLLVLGSAVALAAYLLFGKPVITAMGSLLFTCIAMTAATAATSLHYVIQYGFEFPTSEPVILWGSVAVAIITTVLPTFMASEAIRLIGPERTSIAGTLGPISTTILAIIFLDEPFGWLTAGGMLFVMLGVAKLKH